jgi:hypothetical protein
LGQIERYCRNRYEISMKWFRTAPRLFLEPELEAWHLAAWGWLLANFGGIESLRQRPLVTPTRTFFTPTETTGHDRIAHVFAEVKQHAGLGDWHCALVAQPAQPGLRVGELVALQRQTHAPAGTFGLDGNEPLITYDPALESDPLKLVAVLAHELAHLRMLACAGPLPGGEPYHERATDLATVVLGFGLFGSNCAFGFERYQDPISQGWRTSRLGYLEEREWAFALAVFLTLTGRAAAPIRRYLKPHLFDDLGKALSSCHARPTLLADLSSTA